MILYLDTEFNGFNGQLISLAMVSPEGHSWYEVCELPALIDPWVNQHVIPYLGREALRPLIFRSNFQQWVTQFDNPDVYCDWHADGQHFCAMMAGINYGSSIDFAFTLHILKTPPGKPVSIMPHNALEDAKALMEWHQNL